MSSDLKNLKNTKEVIDNKIEILNKLHKQTYPIPEAEFDNSYYGEYSLEETELKTEEESLKSYTALWRAVILQMIIDCKSESKREENKRAKEQNLRNLQNEKYNNFFNTMCKEARMNPQMIKQEINCM